MHKPLASAMAVLLISSLAVAAGNREEQVRKDIKTVGNDPNWVYNDLDKGIAEAKRANKPMLVVFRCIP